MYRLLHKGFESILKMHGGNLRLCPTTQVVWGEATEKWGHHSFHSCLPVSDHAADAALTFCQLKPSTPQSRSILWWRLLKFKYMYLSVDLPHFPLCWLTVLMPTKVQGLLQTWPAMLHKTPKLSPLASLYVHILHYNGPLRKHPAVSGRCLDLSLWLG